MGRNPRKSAWVPCDYELHDIRAAKAIAKGEATPDQQKQFYKWLIYVACEKEEIAFRSDSDGGERETSFALGRQYVARMIEKMVNMRGSEVQMFTNKGSSSAE